MGPRLQRSPGFGTQRARSDAYDAAFFDYVARTSAPAADCIAKIVCTLLPVRSVLDVGCGYGTWLKAWHDNGVSDLVGIDGPWVDAQRLQDSGAAFVAANMEAPVFLDRRFDLVQSLEVAEHLPAHSAAMFIDTLTAHGDAVLFSAAPPGQGGEHHINEQPYEYWRALFESRGFIAFDCIRPLISTLPFISPWYRYNTLLYLRAADTYPIPGFAAMFQIGKNERIRDVAPWAYRLRRRIVRRLPGFVQHAAARTIAIRSAGPRQR